MAGGGGTFYDGTLVLPKGFAVTSSNSDTHTFYLCDGKLSMSITPRQPSNGGPSISLSGTRCTSLRQFAGVMNGYIVLVRSGGGGTNR